jgi:hypothetical protein
MHTLIVYAHLIAACVAVGILLSQDLMLSRTGGKRLSLGAVKDLQRAAKTISSALVVLWISGIALVSIGRFNDPNYLMNQKLWAKFAVVVVLTVNGAVLHHFSFPRVTSSTGVVGLRMLEQILVVSTGATSTVSWLFACYLGVARPWNHNVQFDWVLFVYLSLLLPACVIGCAYMLGLSAAGVHGSGAPRTRAPAPAPAFHRSLGESVVRPALSWMKRSRGPSRATELPQTHRDAAKSVRIRPA